MLGETVERAFCVATALVVPQGDLTLGNVSKSYFFGQITAEFRGAVNTALVLDWVAVNFPDLHQLVLVGESSGSIAVSVWVTKAFNILKPKKITVMADASPALLRGECPGLLLYSSQANLVNSCSLLPSEELRAKCEARETFDWLDVVAASVPLLGPNALWVDVSAKVDSFLRLLLSTISVASLELIDEFPQCTNYSFTFERGGSYYAQVSSYYAELSKRIPNFLVYLVNTTTHVMFADYDTSYTSLTEPAQTVEVTNPFAGGSAIALVGETTAPPSPYLVANAAAEDGSMPYPVSLVDWVKSVVDEGAACSHCDGAAVGDYDDNFLEIDSCDASVLEKCYDGVIYCEDDDDCPVGSVCAGAMHRRSLAFGYRTKAICKAI